MAETRQVVVTGATGLVGQALCKQLQQAGYAVVVFSRNPDEARAKVPGAASYVAWKPEERGPWASAVDGAYAVINLAGASIASQRWDDTYKRALYDSRIVGTRGLVNAIAQAASKPKVLINGSAVGYYGYSDDDLLAEDSPPGEDFLARLCLDWEAAAHAAEQHAVRVVCVRTGIVLDADEGALAKMIVPFKLFVGGPIMPGTQWMSWVHLQDEVGIIMLALQDAGVYGPINATAPNPVTNNVFSKTLGDVLHRPSLVPVPGLALQATFGEMADALLINGQRVLPRKAQSVGYRFAFPELKPALRDTLKR